MQNTIAKKIWYFFAIGFGIGKISWIPVGTIASIFSIPIWWGLIYFCSYRMYYLFLVISVGIGIFFCDQTIKIIGIHDHKSIVWDEFVGMWITLSVVPIYSIFWIIVAFVLFRILDIVKPWPISWCDHKIKGGIGVMLDDIIASIISIYIILYFMNLFDCNFLCKI